eukprot:scaffold33055_cov55-Phaeocystis_antarctica.AAC.5
MLHMRCTLLHIDTASTHCIYTASTLPPNPGQVRHRHYRHLAHHRLGGTRHRPGCSAHRAASHRQATGCAARLCRSQRERAPASGQGGAGRGARGEEGPWEGLGLGVRMLVYTNG